MNRIRLVAVAAALVAAGSAQALTPAQIGTARTAGTLKEVRIAGASALRLSVAAYMKEICDASSFHVFWNTNAEGTGYCAYSCNLGVAQGAFAAGTPVLVYKRDTGGSSQGVAPIARAEFQDMMFVDNSCTTINGGSTPATDAAVPNYICPTVNNSFKSDAGISDVEPTLLQQTINLPSGATALSPSQLGTLNVGPLVQALFAVAVNQKAYIALQKAQGILPVNATAAQIAAADVPADQATWTAADIANIPSVPQTFARAYLNGALLGGAANSSAKRGWNIVIPTSVDAGVNTKTLNVCRRAEGSGTQAATNAFFSNAGCPGANLVPLGVAGSSGNETTTSAVASGVPFVVQEGTSAGQVENCLGADANGAAGDAYAMGVLGREANPKRAGGDLGYRYVKLDGVAPLRAEGKAGAYPVVFEASMQWNTTVVPSGSALESFLLALRNGFGSPNGLAAVDSDTQQGVMSPPASYSGSYADAAGNAALFGSRVSRAAGNSCAPLRIVK